MVARRLLLFEYRWRHFGQIPPAFLQNLEGRQERFDFRFDQISDFAELFGRHFAGVGDLPVFAAVGDNKGALVAAAHGDGDVDGLAVELLEAFRSVGREVVAKFFHGFDRFGIYFAGRT